MKTDPDFEIFRAYDFKVKIIDAALFNVSFYIN